MGRAKKESAALLAEQAANKINPAAIPLEAYARQPLLGRKSEGRRHETG
jgi:hypothetical protein